MKTFKTMMSEMNTSKIKRDIEMLKFGLSQHDETDENYIEPDRLENLIVVLQNKLDDEPTQDERDEEGERTHNNMKFEMNEGVEKGLGLYFRNKQGNYLNQVKGEQDVDKKLDILSEQMVSLSSLVLVSVFSSSGTLNKNRSLLRK